MIITGLHQTSPERFRVCFEDGTEIRTTLGVIADLRLFQGKDLDEKQIEDFRIRSVRSLMLEKSIEMLSFRQMSCKELRDSLMRKGTDADTAEYCSAKLVSMGLMDDSAYASSLARHYASRGYGAGKVRAELSRRGISRDLWDDALDEIKENSDRLDSFVRAKLTDPDDREQVRKVSAALFRRGYSWEEISSALRRYNTEPEDY